MNCAVSNIENYNTYDADEKDKTMSTVTALNKIQNCYDFPTCVKLREGTGSGSASKWKVDPDRHQNDADPLHWV